MLGRGQTKDSCRPGLDQGGGSGSRGADMDVSHSVIKTSEKSWGLDYQDTGNRGSKDHCCLQLS